MKPVHIDRLVVARFFGALFLFLLPWQTRWVWQWGTLASGPWEYGTLGIFASEIVFWLTILALPLARFREKKSVPLWLGIFGLVIAWAAASVLWSPERAVSALAVLHLLEAFLLVHLFRLLDDDRTHRWFVWAFLAGAVVQAFFAIGQMVAQVVPASTILGTALHDPSVPGTAVVAGNAGRLLRAYAGFPHPNVAGGFFMAALLLGFAKYMRTEERSLRTALIAGVLVIGAALFGTFSRGAWLGAIAGIVVLGITGAVRADRATRRRFFAGIGALTLLAVALVSISYDTLSTRFTGQAPLEVRSIEERAVSFVDARSVVRLAPWIGTGLGQYTVRIAELMTGRPSWAYQPVHAVPILILAELGIIGATLVLAVAIALFSWVIKERVTGGAFAALIGLVVVSLVDHYLWSLYAGMLLVAVVVSFLLHEAKNFQTKN